MEYQVIRSNRKTISITINLDGLTVRAPLHATDMEIRHFLQKHQKWIDQHLAEAKEKRKIIEDLKPLSAKELQQLTDNAKILIPQRVAYYAPKIGVHYGKITIRHQKTRWGSCSGKGNLNFNCLLMLTPPDVLDSVVVHELCHLKEMNHSKKFYDEILKVFPNYQLCKKWLKENGSLLLARMR